MISVNALFSPCLLGKCSLFIKTTNCKTQNAERTFKNGLPYSIFTNCLGFNCVAIQTLKDSSSQTVGLGSNSGS